MRLWQGSTATSTRCSRSAAGCWTGIHERAEQRPPGGDAMSERRRTGYAFIAPALTLIAVFFLLPVAASFLLSLTDFDIYAVAQRANLRFVGAHNYAALLRDP